MICYTDFFPRYCPACGSALELEREFAEAVGQDFLEGQTCTCQYCGLTCCYIPEHHFPYQRVPTIIATA
jgi:hypothetical protein